jgi:tyrosinase
MNIRVDGMWYGVCQYLRWSALARLSVCAALLLAACAADTGVDEHDGHGGSVEPLSEADRLAALNPEYIGVERSRRTKRVRKNVKDLTRKERRQYVDAVLKLKKTKSPFDSNLSYYDQFVAWHIQLCVCEPGSMHADMMQGHGGPVFLPWHRLFTLLFENALRKVGGKDITVPYWDWTDNDPSVVFRDDFMGGGGDPSQNFAVTTGPFRKGKWTLNVKNPGTRWAMYDSDHLRRTTLAPPPFPLPTPADVAAALAVPTYDVAPFDDTADRTMSFRNNVEGNRGDVPRTDRPCGEDGTMPLPVTGTGLHNGIHGWIGGLPQQGTMILPISPSDPTFFLHHSQIDRLWALWQEQHGVDTYQPVSGLPHNNVDDVMTPFDADGIEVTPGDLADIRELGYEYR